MNAVRLPSLSGRDVIRALEAAGFVVIRVKGSHHMLRHPDDPTRQTVVPVHARKSLGRGLVAKILRDAGMTSDEFEALL